MSRRSSGVVCRLIVVSLLALVLTGCSILPKFGAKDRREDQVYFLDPAFSIVSKGNGYCGSLMVETVVGAPGFRGSKMLYSVEPLRLRHYAHAKWADNPGRMLTNVVRSGLQESGLFANVLTAPSVAPTDWRLDISNLYLLQVYENAEASRSVVKIEAEVRLYNSMPPRLLDTMAVNIQLPAPPNPQGGAQAVNTLSVQLITLLNGFLETNCSKRADVSSQ